MTQTDEQSLHGDAAQAEVRADTSTTVSGAETSDANLSLRDTLAAALTKQRKYEEAESILRANLATREANGRGSADPELLATMNNLGGVLNGTGRWTEAETLFRQTLELYQERLGREHKDIIVVNSNLAFALGHQGKWEEAESVQREALASSSKAYGPEARETLTLMEGLGTTLHHLHSYEEAETLLRQSLQARLESAGDDHPDTANNMNNLASLLRKRKKDRAEAESLYRQALALENNDVDRLYTISNLAGCVRDQGRYDEAETLFRQAWQYSQTLKEHDDEKKGLRQNFGDVLIRNGKYSEAEDILRGAT